jgi:erythromycin esterase-like protein
VHRSCHEPSAAGTLYAAALFQEQEVVMVTSSTEVERAVVEAAHAHAHPIHDEDLSCYDTLLESIGDARVVMIGDASHGTHEFYRERARLTTRLIRDMDVSFVAIEGDWPEAYAVHRFACGGEGTARDVMNHFNVFPTWMWGNLDALHFVEWLRAHNTSLPDGRRPVGFYGLDLYSMYASMQYVVQYLEGIDPEAAEMARRRYACFEPFSSRDTYAYSVGLGVAESCEEEAVAALQDLQARRATYLDVVPEDAQFFAEMSAMAARDGEAYYRSMYRSDISSWNVRDRHMVRTLDSLLEHFGPETRAVVWEHNTHIGDFRATADAGDMVNVGQLVRERYGTRAYAIGFGTYVGSVTAATEWGGAPQRMDVPPAQAYSTDRDLHAVGQDRFYLLLRDLDARGRAEPFHQWRGQRAIGVVYRPEYERGNYVQTRLADRYDAYVHIDRTRAVKPTWVEPTWVEPMQQTYPTGY